MDKPHRQEYGECGYYHAPPLGRGMETAAVFFNKKKHCIKQHTFKRQPETESDCKADDGVHQFGNQRKETVSYDLFFRIL